MTKIEASKELHEYSCKFCGYTWISIFDYPKCPRCEKNLKGDKE